MKVAAVKISMARLFKRSSFGWKCIGNKDEVLTVQSMTMLPQRQVAADDFSVNVLTSRCETTLEPWPEFFPLTLRFIASSFDSLEATNS